MAAGIFNYQIEQGATFDSVITWRDPSNQIIRLDGYTAAMQIRPAVDSDQIISSLTTTNSKIVLGALDGTVTLSVPATETATWTFTKAVYDLELTAPSGRVWRFLKGKVSLDPEVTR